MPKASRMLAVALSLVTGWCAPLSASTNLVVHDGVPYTIDAWETDDGLPQNSVVALAQTRDGYLWLGTLNGLVRFDGIRFTVFDESNTPGLPSSRIVSLFEDRRTNLWLGTETSGAAVVRNGRVTALDLGRGNRAGRLLAACEDRSGAVWLCTADGQLARYRDGQVDVFRLAAERFSNRRTLLADDTGLLWAGTDWGLFAIDPRAAAGSRDLPIAQALPAANLDLIVASRGGGYWRLGEGRVQKWTTNRVDRDWGPYQWNRSVSCACEDAEGNLVVGTQGAGVYWFDPKGSVTRLSTEQGLSHNYILSLLLDHEGSLWIGTDGGGLNRVKRQVFDTLNATRGRVVQTVCESAGDGIWIGYNGGGVDHWDGERLERFGPAEGLPENLSVRAVLVDAQRRVWAGTWGIGLLQLQNGRFRRAPGAEALHPVILALQQDRRGRLWVGTLGGLARWDEQTWKVFTTRDGLAADAVSAIAEDADGALWIGTQGGGLNRLRNGTFEIMRKAADGLPGNDISSLLLDEDGVLWVGTTDSGLGRFQGGRWTRYTVQQGLAGNGVGYLVEDGVGNLWIGSTAGLMRVPKQALNGFAADPAAFLPIRTYGRPDGLPTRECTLGSQPAACRTRTGVLELPTIKGLASVDPVHLKLNTNRPPVVIESVSIGGQTLATDGLRTVMPASLTIPAGRERLEIHYTSLNLAAPDRARFQYWLEGHETAWTDALNSRIARYSWLPPGRYQFHVRACNEDGVWNLDGSSIALTVQQFYWRTWWFLTLAGALVLGGIVGFVHYVSTQKLYRQLERMRQQQAVEKERGRIARDIHDQLGASLTQVSLLGELVEGEKDSPAEVAGYARQISQTARDTTRALDEIVWTVNPSNDTLDSLITYICKHAQDYLEVAGLRYRLEVPPKLPAATVSPDVRHNVFLAAKEAITNVVRHAQATSVWLRLKLEPGGFCIEIQDDGRGLASLDAKRAASRNGLSNMRRRMEEIGGSFSLSAAPERGALVRLHAPLPNA